MATENLTIVYPKGAMEVRGGTPIAQDGTVANNANAYGVLETDIKWPETTGAVIVSGEVDYDWACSNSGIGIVKEAADAMSGITFVQDDGEPYVFPCSGGGSVTDPILENAKSTGGIGYTEGDSTTIEWDGDTSGLVSAADSYYKVANYTTIAKADLIGCVLSLQNDDTHPTPFAIEEDDINDSVIPHAIMISDYAIFVSEPTSYGPFSFAESGIYFVKMGEVYTKSLTYGNETIHKIDTKYIDIDSLKTALGLS